MNKVLVFLFLGLVMFGFVSGAEENIHVIVLEKDISLVKTRTMSSNSVFSLPENKVVNRYSSLNGYSTEVTPEEFEALKNNPLIDVFVNDMYHANLDVSIPQINADDVWDLNLNSINITGSGQTVCVIDTGVDYTHPAFGNCYGENNISSSCKIIGGYDFVNNDDDPFDDDGHGTHVSGTIASGNDTYAGVSPDVKIIAIKALDENGNGWGGNITKGIDWCVNNASKFNISVISMSLGDDSTYNTYCNDNYFASFIDNAVANNITVVVSAGNCDFPGQTSCTTGVAVPACVESAVIAGAVNDADSISFMRGNLLEIMAPGVGIISTVIGGGYDSSSGTSMSAPHISGVIALLKQYIDSSGQLKTPSEIESILNSTGKQINDTSGTNLNYSRVDAYSALLSLDVDLPNVTLVSPNNSHINSSVNQTFICNATDWQLANVTLKVWNSSGLYYNFTNNLTGTANETSFNLTNMSTGNYEWNCLAFDDLGNFAFASSNYSLTVGGVRVNMSSPVNNTYTNINETNFTCISNSESDYELVNVTFSLWNSTGDLVYNLTENISGFDNETIFNWTFEDEDDYSWECLAINNNSDEGDGVNYSISYDISDPSVENISISVSTTSATISWDSGELVNASINYGTSESLGSFSNNTNFTLNHSIELTGLSSSTPYYYNITSCDKAGNCVVNGTNSFTTSTAVVTGGGNSPSSGGPSSSTVASNVSVIPNVSTSNMSKGYTDNLEKGDKINFSLFDFTGGNHLLTVEEIGDGFINLTIESDPINFIIGVGESVKLNLTSPNYYDLHLRLNSIINGSANLTMQSINEPIELKENETELTAQDETVAKDYYLAEVVLPVFLSIVIVVMIIIMIAFNRKKLKSIEANKKDGKKNKKIKA